MACIFKDYLSTCNDDSDVFEISEQRLKSVKSASETRSDGLAEVCLKTEQPILAHKNCLSTYTSPTHIVRYLKRKDKTQNVQANQPKRKRLSRETFLWKEQCFFCGEKCDIEPDSKHPDRWR